jgi:hypothetical protein
MPQSLFLANATQYIDGVTPTFAMAGRWDLGVQYVGASKGFVRRTLASFNVFGGAMSGRPLAGSDTIVSAELIANVTLIIGPSGWPATIERITRVDWDYATADWTHYKTGASWTVAGGDVATPPAAVGFTSPSTTGDAVISGLLEFVTDAIALRSGLVIVRLRANNEAPAQTQWCNFDAMLTSAARPRLRVTYESATPAPIAEWHGTHLGVAAGNKPAAPSGHAAPARPARPTR